MEGIKMKKNKEEGITLIALVVTIIVLLILAGVAIATLVGENGILSQANTAGEDSKKAEIIERAQMDIFAVQAENEGKLTKGQFVGILETYFVGVPTEENLPEDLTTLTLTTKAEYGTLQINIAEIYNGTFSDASVAEEKTVEDLVVGEKVYYDTGNTNIGDQGIIECTVLYDKAYNEARGTNYGIQIISTDVIKNSEGTAVTVPLGDDDNTVEGSGFEKARNSYNNALKRLYEEAQKYLNETYASGARCVGSDPANSDWDTTTDEAGYFTKTEGENDYYAYMKNYYGTFKDADDKYNTDWTQMGKITGIKPASREYCLASRGVYSSSSATTFWVCNVNASSGGLRNEVFIGVESGGSRHYGRPSYGFRPVFTLNSGIKITEGDGVDTPYTLTP